MWLFAIITASGILGVVLQAVIPRIMTDRVERETVYEQIPEVIRNLRFEADERVEYLTADLGLESEEKRDGVPVVIPGRWEEVCI